MGEIIQFQTARVVRFTMYLSSDHSTPATGKTVTVTLGKTTGAFANPSAGATTATEIGGGDYHFTLSTTDTGTAGDLFCKFTATACDEGRREFTVGSFWTVLDARLPDQLSDGGYMQSDIRAWIDNPPAFMLDTLLSGHTTAGTLGGALDAMLASTGLITSSGVYVISAYANGDLSIVRGDSYGVTSGQTLIVTKPTGASWPTITGSGWVVVFTATKRTDNTATGTATLTSTATITSATTVRIDLTAAQTTGLALGVNGWTWQLEAANGLLRKTLISGNMSVLEDLKIT